MLRDIPLLPGVESGSCSKIYGTGLLCPARVKLEAWDILPRVVFLRWCSPAYMSKDRWHYIFIKTNVLLNLGHMYIRQGILSSCAIVHKVFCVSDFKCRKSWHLCQDFLHFLLCRKNQAFSFFIDFKLTKTKGNPLPCRLQTEIK